MMICACGCGLEIPSHPLHKYHPPTYINGHYQKLGLSNKGHFRSSHHVAPGTSCACGCGTVIPTLDTNGNPRYVRGKAAFILGHNATGRHAPRSNRGRKVHTKRGYIYLYMPEHPSAQKGTGYVSEHRIVMEAMMGRLLTRSENVHHLNGVRDDNRPENLELWIKPQPAGIRLANILPHCPTCTCRAH